MPAHDWLEQARRANLAAGTCPECGGTGLVADLARITRTGDPHANRTCRTCHGRGVGAQPSADAVDPHVCSTGTPSTRD